MKEVRNLKGQVWRCKTKGCHLPYDEHRCWGRGLLPEHVCFGSFTHQHRPKKGMGGNNPDSKVVASLCAGLHDQLDNNAGRPWKDEVRESMGRMFYRIFDPSKSHIQTEYAPVWIEITDWVDASTGTLEPTAEALTEYGEGEEASSRLRGGMTVPSSDNFLAVVTSPNVVAENTAFGPGVSAGHPRPFDVLQPMPDDLTFEEWMAWGEMLGRVSNVAMWRIGEWLAKGEDRGWGQKYTHGMDVTRKSYSTLSGYVRVVKAFKDLPLLASLPFSVYDAIAPIALRDKEKAEKLLIQAEAEEWTGTVARDRVVEESGGTVEYQECSMGFTHRTVVA